MKLLKFMEAEEITTPPFRHPSAGGEFSEIPLLRRGGCRPGW